jgi:hypothetical protein
VSVGGAGYSYGWRVSDCGDGLGDAFCEKIPINGVDDNANPNGVNNNSKTPSDGGKIAAGVLVPILVVGIVGALAYRHKQQGASLLGAKFISTSGSAYSDVNSDTFTSMTHSDGAASL